MGENEIPGNVPRQDQLLEEASFWFARMRGPDAEQYRADFDAWLALGAVHLGAYNRAGEIFALGKFLAESPNAAADGDGGEHYSAPSRWRGLAILASILLVVGIGAWVGQDSFSTMFGRTPEIALVDPAAAPDGQRLSTVGGARRSFRLDDGSTVTLDAESVLSTTFDSQRRALRLERGRARFEVAHETRPFVVLAGGGSVTARGTIFDVIINQESGVTVRLLRGAVDVVRPSEAGDADPDKQATTRLVPGEVLSFGDGRMPDLAATTKVRDVVAGAALPDIPVAKEFDMAPLSQVIAEANRGAAIPIRVADPAVGALKVSGRFRVDNPELTADRLAALFDLKIDRTRHDEILLRSR
ncbi:FecR family protein [Sphingobium sp. KCTC 72723]|uniref:FecR family protein n=1 Tax=Sphingobium sp. KCTC 72723 TaxID=2733867 RepID=UPI00165DDFD3|nr:FecR domain-containing protein [Sphingobium sp. KCTC 72723]